jgi:hypothetical protein
VITVPAMLTTATVTTPQTYSADTYKLIRIAGSFTAGMTLQISNMTQGRFMHIFIQNTNATARIITLTASTTTSGYAAPNFTVVGAGGASTNTVSLAGTTGCAYFYVTNVLGTIVAFRQ